MNVCVAQTGVLDALRRLDARLLRIVDSARRLTGREPGADPFRGLYVNEADFLRSLVGAKGDVQPFDSAPLAAGDEFASLGEMYRLTPFDLDTLFLALAPEIEPRYERIFAYLQDDVNRRRPSVDLILNLLCGPAQDRLNKRAALSASGALVRNRLIRLSGDDWTPLPRREICIDPRIAAFLVGDDGVDSRLAGLATLIDSASQDGAPADDGLVNLILNASAPLVIYLRSADEQAKRAQAAALAREAGAAMLIGETGRASRRSADFDEWLTHLARETRLRSAIVYHDGWDELDDSAKETVLRAFSEEATVILSGTQEWRPCAARPDVMTAPFEAPGWHDRRRTWESALREQGMDPPASELDMLAESFRFHRSQISAASEVAASVAKLRREPMQMNHVFEAARGRSGTEMTNLARKVPAARGWDELILPEPPATQLREICNRVALRHRVIDEWGFGRRLSGGKGVTALFHGHSGTGKTMAAEVIARELKLDLYKIDLSGVVSKYIGETEKNLEHIFTAAENSNVILLFDEADALFGKRSEVRDSHDRYANLEVSYLLQRMEAYEGLSILSTNLRQNLDQAFLRRLAFIVPFPFPDEASRLGIWQGIWPNAAPLDTDVDLKWVANRFLLSGGNIRNAAVAAAFFAAEEKSPVSMAHILRGVQGEFQKMGKTLSAADLAPQAAPAGATA